MKLLLLVQSEADVTHLDAAARAILNSAITGVWCVFSPAITVDASEAAAKLDGEIGQLKAAERAAAERSDYAAAAGYKTQREGKELDRAKALRDAWKTAPAEEKKQKVNSIFQPFIAQLKPQGLNVKITGHSDHYDREQWVAMLNSLSGVWFKEFAAGGFLVGWPEAVETSLLPKQVLPAPTIDLKPFQKKVDDFVDGVSAPQRLPIIAATGKTITQETIDETLNPPTRRQELTALRTFALYAEAKKVGVDPKGKEKSAIVAAILAAEQAQAVATPEAVEAY